MDLDLIASSLTHKLPRYYSWHPDPGTEAVDAFTMPWNNVRFQAFPPFSLTLRVARKVRLEEAHGVGLLVTPRWKAQPLYGMLQRHSQKQLQVPRTSLKNPVTGETLGELAAEPCRMADVRAALLAQGLMNDQLIST